MPMAKVGEVNIHYTVEGQGAPLLLIMGYRGSGFMWGEELLALLVRHFQVISFDNRGTGLSDKPDSTYTMAMLADDAAGLLTHLRLPKTSVFGVSMGGMIAQELALRHSRRVQRLILGCTSCGGPQAIVASPEVLNRLLAPADLSHEEAVRRQWSIVFSPGFVATQAPFLERMTARALAHPTPFYVGLRQILAMQRFNTYGRLGQILVPTLVVTGDQDLLIPPANSLLLAERIPGASLKVIAGTGHGFFWEAPEAVVALLREFCAVP